MPEKFTGVPVSPEEKYFEEEKAKKFDLATFDFSKYERIEDMPQEVRGYFMPVPENEGGGFKPNGRFESDMKEAKKVKSERYSKMVDASWEADKFKKLGYTKERRDEELSMPGKPSRELAIVMGIKDGSYAPNGYERKVASYSGTVIIKKGGETWKVEGFGPTGNAHSVHSEGGIKFTKISEVQDGQ